MILHFPSLDACLQHLKTKFPPSHTVRLDTAKDFYSQQEESVRAPAYLYRGESREYPMTTSSMHRLWSDETLSLDVRTTIKDTVCALDQELQEFLNCPPMISAGFLQHYGAPTELIDVTASLETAAFFATGIVGERGSICVFSVAEVVDRCVIVDLTEYPVAERPQRQTAYALFHKSHFDLKSHSAIADLQLKWFSFTLTDDDKLKYGANSELLDAYTDRAAGVLQLLMDNFDKISDTAAKWLSDRIVPAPFVTEVIDEYSPGQPRTVELIPLCESSLDYNEGRERESNYRNWSLAHPETRKHRLR